MTIEHKTTHGPNQPGQLAADWMLESGATSGVIAGRTTTEDRIRLAVRNHDNTLTLESAAALKDALTVHLRNMGWDDPDTAPTPSPGVRLEVQPGAGVTEAEVIARALRRETVRGVGYVSGMTDAEAFGVGELRTGSRGCLEDPRGELYTDEAGRELVVKAGRHRATLAWLEAPPAPREEEAPDAPEAEEAGLASPVTDASGNWVTSRTVRKWTDEQCRGAWNHAMDNTPRPGRLTDRPTGREYSPLAGDTLRARLNQINGADAPRD